MSSQYKVITLLLQLWNSNIIKDTYMGKHCFLSADECHNKIHTVGLKGRGKAGTVAPGQVYVRITQVRNTTTI